VDKNWVVVDWTHHKQNLVAPWRCYLLEHTRNTSFRLGAPTWCRP